MHFSKAAVVALGARLLGRQDQITNAPKEPVAVAAAPGSLAPFSTFALNTIYTPGANDSMAYPRVVELESGELLVTISWRGINGSLPVFPIFQSKDGGASWEWISNVTDTQRGTGMTAQPALLQLSKQYGQYPKGTVLAAGNLWGNGKTQIDIYASLDKGHTWKFVSNVAEGGPPSISDGGSSIWEPFLYEYNDELITYYSDSRDPLHSQKLAHQRSKDLLTWGEVVNDVRFANYTDRPGMTVVDKFPTADGDRYIFVHEYPGGINKFNLTDRNYPVYYRISSDPTKFDEAEPIPLIAYGSVDQPSSSPYVVWTSAGGPLGTLVVSDANHGSVFTNSVSGHPLHWVAHATTQVDSYSRALHIFKKNPNRLLILGAGKWPGVDPPGTIRPFYATVVEIEELLKTPPGANKY